MRVEKRHYYCDTCKTEVTDTKHIHIENASWVGIVKPPKFEMKRLGERYFDFCNIKCFEKFIVIKPKKKGEK